MAVTLFLTRTPHDEFIFDTSTWTINDDVDDLTDEERGRLYRSKNRRPDQPANLNRPSGLWCTMMMLVGPAVFYASFEHPFSGILEGGDRIETLTFNGRPLHVVLGLEDITQQKEYTAVERYRGDKGDLNQWGFGYVRMVAQREPYDLKTEYGNSVVKTLRNGHNGECIRIYGGATAQQRAILIHEAPQPGWVVGCIGPRPLGDRRVYDKDDNRNPSALTVREIMKTMTAHGKGRGQLYVLQG